jgi:hypothetical protein
MRCVDGEVFHREKNEELFFYERVFDERRKKFYFHV